MAGLSDLAARLRGWPRRVLALCCLLLAAGSAVAARSSPARSAHVVDRDVVLAARDLPAGRTLALADVGLARWPRDTAPSNALARPAEAVGRRLSTAIRAGEAVTTTRLVGPDLTSGLPPGMVAMTVPLASAAAAALVQPGESVDLMATPSQADQPGASSIASLVAGQVRVLAVIGVPAGAGSAGGFAGSDAIGSNSMGAGDASAPALVVAVDRATALRLAGLAGRSMLAVVGKSP